MMIQKRLALSILGLSACAFGAVAFAQDSEKYPAAAKPAKPARVAIYDEQADARAVIETACSKAQRENQRVLLMFGANWCPWCHKLAALFKSDKAIAHELLYEYQVVLVDVCGPNGKGIGKNIDLAKSYGVDLAAKGAGIPYLAVLSADGKPLKVQATGALEDGDHHDPAKVLSFLKEFNATPLDAAAVLKAGLQKARKSGRPAFVHLSAPWCIWCKRLDAFMRRPDMAPIFEAALVDVEIDQDRMTGAAEIDKSLRKDQKRGGIPWFALLDGDGKTLATSELANGQNIGYPGSDEEIAHFMGMLKSHAAKITPDQLAKIEEGLKEESRKLKAAQTAAEHE